MWLYYYKIIITDAAYFIFNTLDTKCIIIIYNPSVNNETHEKNIKSGYNNINTFWTKILLFTENNKNIIGFWFMIH